MNDYIVIPGNILRNQELTNLQKLLLAKISNLDNDKGCFATNKYFATLLDSSISSVSKTINHLAKEGLIEITLIDNTTRTITLSEKTRGDCQKDNGGCRKRQGSTDTLNIDSNIDYKTIQSISPEIIKEIQSKYTLLDVQDIYEDLVLYCESTGTKYKNYKATLQMWCSRATKKLKESKP
jgi:SOS-response transcriptional repressor LexA